ncbi:exopolysaccharide biosynthesis protein [Ahrensia kielensis]|uniref:exopolysaccharide biosynthesis protein n=1 Tax=Ahrensia kielensis TaxID=76980 RepID=UPI000372B698|nr:exopolysaccharide biosynthesis protein [Ahrensia kielensis]
MHIESEPRGAFDKIEHVLLSKSALPDGGNAEHISLGALSDGMEERAFGLLLLLLALPCGLPFVYGLPQIVALPMLVLVFQMASGRRSPWLPEALRKRKLPVQSFLKLVANTRRYAGWLERLAHARLTSMTSPRGMRLVGALLLIPCASILVPLPLTNTVPGIAVAMTAAGLIERDGVFVGLGILGGLIWVALLVIGGPTLAYLLVDWVLNR